MDEKQKQANELRTEIERLMLEHHDLSGYFFRRQFAPPPPMSGHHGGTSYQDRTRIYALSDVILTNFAAILSIAAKANNNPSDFWDPHVAYIHFICSRSRTLRKRFLKHKDLYNKNLSPLFDWKVEAADEDGF